MKLTTLKEFMNEHYVERVNEAGVSRDATINGYTPGSFGFLWGYIHNGDDIKDTTYDSNLILTNRVD